MTLKEWNAFQIKEALSDTNRYFYWLRYGTNGTDAQLLLFYIENGGARDFKQNHQGER